MVKSVVNLSREISMVGRIMRRVTSSRVELVKEERGLFIGDEKQCLDVLVLSTRTGPMIVKREVLQALCFGHFLDQRRTCGG